LAALRAFSGHRDGDAVAVALGFYVEAGEVPVSRGEALANVGEADAAAATGRRIGIEAVLDGD
jgi:hypothetical protein